jgi:hypothetical protein
MQKIFSLLLMFSGLACALVCQAEVHTLGHFVWHDVNRNGIQEPGEPGINGVNVKLYEAAGKRLIASQTTQNNGQKDGTFLFQFQDAEKV